MYAQTRSTQTAGKITILRTWGLLSFPQQIMRGNQCIRFLLIDTLGFIRSAIVNKTRRLFSLISQDYIKKNKVQLVWRVTLSDYSTNIFFSGYASEAPRKIKMYTFVKSIVSVGSTLNS